MEDKVERIYFRLSSEEKEQYKQQASRLQCTVSEFVRQACREKIQREKSKHGRA